MIQIIPTTLKIDFLRWRYVSFALSALFIVGTFSLLATRGLNYGIDFAGGSLVQIQLAETTANELRKKLTAGNLKGFTIQNFGEEDEFLIRTPENSKYAQNVVQNAVPAAEIRRVEYVGPQIGKELREKGLLAILISMVAILFYISVRFELRYGLGAIAALAHDVVLTVGVFSLMQKEISLTVLAALLTVIGYSLNDTIVVFDRIRENRAKFRKKPLKDVLNLSINEMMNRTLMTSVTTLIALFSLFLWGGEVIHDFAFTLAFGVIVGTYSSVFIAAAVVLYLEKYYQRMAEADETNPTVIKNQKGSE